MSANITLEYLADREDVISVLKEWFERDWAPYYGTDGPGNAEADLRECCNKTELPIAVVAFYDGKPCATAALKEESVTTHLHLSPWLAATLVAHEYRDKGIEPLLAAEIEQIARTLGYTKLYTGAEPNYAPLMGTGWTFLEKVPYYVSNAWIYMKEL